MSEQQDLNVSAQQASAILQFLQRTQMQGAEMPAYVDVFNTLSAIVAAAPAETLADVAPASTAKKAPAKSN
ncbi:MAG: hypothetical protein JKY34_10340 [Kordiimonadaceae bacterium]|nr:hypothetical protein [Kordiimonadaceae bacterium]